MTESEKKIADAKRIKADRAAKRYKRLERIGLRRLGQSGLKRKGEQS